MNTESNVAREALDSQQAAPAVMSVTRPFYWSIRRELWENRWIYIAPLAVAAVFLFGFLVTAGHHVRTQMRAALTVDPGKQRAAILLPYEIAAGLIMVTVFILTVFYCLEALHSERRDRSILFWKSLPVSDITTVLSKATIPCALQLFAFALTFVTQFIMLLLSSAVLAGSGLSVATLWNQVAFYSTSLGLLYHLVTVHILWYAPIYGWLLLVSAWARRAPFLWAVLPPVAIIFLEKLVFDTTYFAALLQYRFSGPETPSFNRGSGSMGYMTHFNLGNFLATPGLWMGLVVAAAFLFAAIRLRRHRGPN